MFKKIKHKREKINALLSALKTNTETEMLANYSDNDIVKLTRNITSIFHSTGCLKNAKLLFRRSKKEIYEIGRLEGLASAFSHVIYCNQKLSEKSINFLDIKTYDPAKDACEEKSHFCNSLNASFGLLRHMINDPNFEDINYIPISKNYLIQLSNYGERAQAVIAYLQDKMRKEGISNG